MVARTIRGVMQGIGCGVVALACGEGSLVMDASRESARLEQAQEIPPYRAPAYPLLTFDPYFSVWSFADRLATDWSRHWTGANHSLQSMVRVDGRPYRLMGMTPQEVPELPQTAVRVWPTRTVYDFVGAGIELRMEFVSPLLPGDLEVLARPAGYVSWRLRATDGRTHAVSLYFDNSAELVVDRPEQKVVWSRLAVPGLTVTRMGSKDQAVLGKVGEDLRIDWGYLYQAIPAGAGVVQAIAGSETARNGFARGAALPESDDPRQPRPAREDWPVLAATLDLGLVSGDWVSRHVILAYDDLYSVEYLNERLRPWWRRQGAEAVDLLRLAAADFERLTRACSAFDAELVSDLERVGGPTLARLGALAYRQTLAAHKLVADRDGTPLFFSKENFSGGFMATVDVTYPSSSLFLLMHPTLLQGMLTPVFEYASSTRWKFPFAPHDLGIYPKANGQAYGGGEKSEQDQMPVEESANMILLSAALGLLTGDLPYVERHWALLSRWAMYLKDQGLDPANQLCTEDFNGLLAHNANLSLKAIMALGAYAALCDRTGRAVEAAAFRDLTERYAAAWTRLASEGDHTRLAFDKPGSWSQKYNLIWDRLLGLGLFSPEIAQQELVQYRRVQQPFGLPLDNRSTQTILPSLVWSASLRGERGDLDALLAPLDAFLDQTQTRVPLTDYFDTGNAQRVAFQARSVVGGVFQPLLQDSALRAKWLTWQAPAP